MRGPHEGEDVVEWLLWAASVGRKCAICGEKTDEDTLLTGMQGDRLTVWHRACYTHDLNRRAAERVAALAKSMQEARP